MQAMTFNCGHCQVKVDVMWDKDANDHLLIDNWGNRFCSAVCMNRTMTERERYGAKR